MESFNIGRTLSRSFAMIGGAFASVGVFLLILQLVNSALSFGMQSMMMGEIEKVTEAASPGAALGMFTSAWYWGTILVSLLLGALTYAGSIAGYLRAEAGEPVTLADCFQTGFAKMLPMLGLTILWWFGVAFGFLLLVVPGVILITIWAAVMPALVAENRGVFDAFTRSRELTRGSRLLVFVVLLIAVVVFYVVAIVMIGGMIGGAAMNGGLEAMASGSMLSPLAIGATALTGWLTAMNLSALIASIYVELVWIKEGGRTGQLGEVFN
jgi:hypothetical protein